ncbi:hypothetical protein PRIPAC_90585 [Pristionchus pacificus]|uniref:STAS domain-containing protein n=1 Tax=Pristionchus pacificus TaxID=54126 RepID=A0A2A6CX23_PRIPA|nr:hypothetical protein PRIPAC_90585 [Pristionchus pacificus]|eukprot:PDM82772.1 hypothetical protein PRIPAC_37165 [Pristionchus pacificus]
MEDVPPASGSSSDFRVRHAFSARLASWGRSAKKISPRALAAKTLSFFPILQWLPQYKWKVSLFGDLSGGLTMGVFNVPQGIALAAITGVNPVYGLYTAIFPSFFYILFGTSKHNSLGGFAVLSLLTAKAIERMDLEWSEANATAPIGMTAGIGSSSLLNITESIVGNGTAFYDEDSLLVDDVIKAGPNSIAIATALLFTSGVLQVMSGFIVGGVVHVFFAQIGPALGLELPIRNGPFYLYYRVSDLIDRFPNIHSPTVVISASSIVFLIVSKEFIGPWLDEVFFFPVPFELVLVIVGITATNFAELASRHSIAVVGNMPTNFPVPTAPQLELSFSLFWEALCILVYSMIALGYIIPLMINIPLLFMGFNTTMNEGVEVVIMLGNTGTLISKIYSTITYVIYCVGGVVLTVLTSKHLSELIRSVTASNALISYFAFTNTLTPEIYDNFIFPLLPPPSGSNLNVCPSANTRFHPRAELYLCSSSFILENCNTIQKSGIGSLASTISFGILTLFSIPLPVLWIFMIVLMFNASGSLGSTFIKFYMCLHRYFVLRDVSMNEQVWSNKFVNYLIALTYIILLLINIPVLCFGFNTRMSSGVEVVLLMGQIAKIYSTVTYIVYCTGTVILTILTGRHLSKLSNQVQERAKREIQRKQKVLFIVVTFCTISHCIKCVHQILWSYLAFTDTLTPEMYDKIIFPTYILTNALANYTAPITLVIASRKAIVATAIHVTVAKYVEKRYDYHIDYGQELYALGFVGVFSSFFPVFPVTSGFQRSVVGAAVGGSTQLTGLFSSVALLSVILYIGPALEYLPKCVLASMMLVSLKNSFLKIRELGQLWPTFKIDAAKVALPHRARERHLQAVNRCISIWSKKRAAEFVPLEEMQGNAERLDEKISRFRSKRWIRKPEKTRDDRVHLVVDCTRMPFVDYEGLRTLKKVYKDKSAEGVDIVLVVYQADLLKKFDATDFYQIVGRDRVFTSIEEAVEAGGIKNSPISHPPLIQLDSMRASYVESTSPPCSIEDDDCPDSSDSEASIEPPTPAPIGDLLPVSLSHRTSRPSNSSSLFDFESYLSSSATSPTPSTDSDEAIRRASPKEV